MITLAASAGGIDALTTILRTLPPDLPAAVVVVQHRTARPQHNHLTKILERVAAPPVVMAEEGHMIEPMVIAQHPASAAHASMPAAAVRSGAVDFVLPLREIGPALDAIVRGRPLHV